MGCCFASCSVWAHRRVQTNMKSEVEWLIIDTIDMTSVVGTASTCCKSGALEVSLDTYRVMSIVIDSNINIQLLLTITSFLQVSNWTIEIDLKQRQQQTKEIRLSRVYFTVSFSVPSIIIARSFNTKSSRRLTIVACNISNKPQSLILRQHFIKHYNIASANT